MTNVAIKSPALALVRVWPPLVAFALGTVILYGVAFSAIPVLHNAAHDSRHAMGFPCH